jgi:hypothetical protein
MITGNKGEWSEIYALFKLLGDKKLLAGDANLQAIENLFFPIIKIIRNESGGNYEYEVKGDIVVVSGGIEKLNIPIKNFTYQATSLLEKIKGSSGTFSIPEIEIFMKEVNCKTLKAKSTSKSDIKIVVYDSRVNHQAELGFSIKSRLGGDSTLLNAGKTTNFKYTVTGVNGNSLDINTINSIDSRSKIKDRLNQIKKLGGTLKFDSLEQDVFKNNLVLIDSLLPEILGEVVKHFYTSNKSMIKELTEVVNESNPLGYDKQFSHSFYEYKIKRFLTDVALGMMPSKVWGGIYDATGGYLLIKESGEILCYHIYNRNQFEDYLFENTKLETASSNRHEFGSLFIENTNIYIMLNLQIRFI